MTVTIKTGMIMAAGHGHRMRPLTETRPKPLIEVKGRTLLDRGLDRLEMAGVETVVVNVHYLGEMVIDHLKTRKAPNIIISDECDALLDTGGGLMKAKPHFGTGPIFTHNSDAIWLEGYKSALEEMKAFWDDTKMDALMLLASTTSATGYAGRGDFLMDGLGRLTRRPEVELAPFVWAGVQILHPRVLQNAPEGAFSTNIFWNRMIEEGRLYGIRLDGTWMHVGSPSGLKEAEQLLSET